MFRYYEYDILWGIAGRSTAESNRIKCKLSFFLHICTYLPKTDNISTNHCGSSGLQAILFKRIVMSCI